MYDSIIFLTKNWNKKPIIITDQKFSDKLFLQTSLALVCSGTASLEISKRQIPQLIIYKLNFITEIIFRLFVSVKYANIINIMANNMIIPEIVNSKLNPVKFLEYFKKLIHNYENINYQQIVNSKKYLSKLELDKSPDSIAANEIKDLFF